MLAKFDDDKLALPSRLYPPRIGFDADYNRFKIRNTDTRDNPRIECTIGGKNYVLDNDNRTSYTLPSINKYYNAIYTLTPTRDVLKTITGTFNIFSNHPDCKYFRYDGDKYDSTHIIEYKGIENNIVIPEMHNMLVTKTANLTEFPKVQSTAIKITTPSGMDSFWIKENRITDFTINSPSFISTDYQFSDLTNLKSVKLKSNGTYAPHMFENCTAFTTLLETGRILNVGDYAFYNCKNLNLNLNTLRNIVNLGEYAFYNSPMKTIRLSASYLPNGCFDYSENPFQKVIFTTASSINGLTNRNMAVSNYTGGMLYDGDKKHQVYCDVTDTVWGVSGETEEDNLTWTYDKTTQYFEFKTDPNLLGLDINVYRPTNSPIGGITGDAGTTLGHVFLIPTHAGEPASNYPSFDFTNDYSRKIFKCYFTYLYGTSLTHVLDEISIRGITHSGVMEKVNRYTLNGLPINNAGLSILVYTNGDYTETPWADYRGYWYIMWIGSPSIEMAIYDSSGMDVTSKYLRKVPPVVSEATYNSQTVYRIDLNGKVANTVLNSEDYYIRLATSTENLTKEDYYVEVQMQKQYTIF